MRLYLLPISTRRTLLYAQRLNVQTKTQQQGQITKWTTWGAQKWSEWERRDSGWQRKVADYGNSALQRIPYEEWGLKSVPSLSARRRDDELKGREKVELVFPGAVIPVHKAEGIARTLATERLPLHWRMFMWSLLGIPLTAPFFVVPIIPNLPLYYVGYRAWSHWRALQGGKHVQWLSEKKLLLPSPSETLDKLYSADAAATDDDASAKERMLLTTTQVRSFSSALEIPALEAELERAVRQVEGSLKERDTKDGAKRTTRDEETRSGEKDKDA